MRLLLIKPEADRIFAAVLKDQRNLFINDRPVNKYKCYDAQYSNYRKHCNDDILFFHRF